MKGLILQNLTPGTPSKKPKKERKQTLHLVDGKMVTVKYICKKTNRNVKSVQNFMNRHKCTLEEALVRYDSRMLEADNNITSKMIDGYI